MLLTVLKKINGNSKILKKIEMNIKFKEKAKFCLITFKGLKRLNF